jgi:hypothetical protein
MDRGARSGELADALVRQLEETGHHSAEQARRVARSLERADSLGSGEARVLALTEARDTAQDLRYWLREGRKRSVKDARRAQDDLDFVMDASPWIGEERLAGAHERNQDATEAYTSESNAGWQVRLVVRSIKRDLADEAAAARKRRRAQRSSSKRHTEPDP